jgi:integrase
VFSAEPLGKIRQNSYTVGLMESRSDSTPAPELTFLTQDGVRRLFAVISGKRDRALFQLAYHHGLRASEVSLLQRQDIHDRQGRIYIPCVKGSISKTYPVLLKNSTDSTPLKSLRLGVHWSER